MISLIDDLKDAVNVANVPSFRPEMAFPYLTEEMVGRLRAYGDEQTVAANTILFRRGDREVDLFVVLDGSIEVHTVDENEQDEPLTVLESFQFSGELDLLNSQRTVVGARTSADSTLLRIRRNEVQHVMRAEGDIANLIMQAVIWRRIGMVAEARGGIVLVGAVSEPLTIQLQRFLIRNGYPYRLLDSESVNGTRVPRDDGSLPAVILSDGHVLSRPALALLADELGLSEVPDRNATYDVIVVGAGPSGLAAAVYAASEGLSTLVIESIAPGGQAGTSSKIENYLGWFSR